MERESNQRIGVDNGTLQVNAYWLLSSNYVSLSNEFEHLRFDARNFLDNTTQRPY